jgi:alpha-mannosidase
MKYQQLIIALPCHSLEDFPLYHTGEAAEGLLANWTALWHPALIASAEAVVTWCRCDTPPEDLDGRLIVIPSVGASELPTGFAQRAKEQGAVVVRKLHVRSEIVAAALQELDGGDAGVPAELADDFFALGYCYLQVQLLTRQMRYASNLDEVHFKNVAVTAAKAAISADYDQARERLQACFNLLAEERDRYYPVEAFVLDLTLVGPTTIGNSLREEIRKTEAAASPGALPQTTNLLISGETLALIAKQEPETLALLRDAVTAQRVGLVGGHYHEGQTSLLARESLLADFEKGLATYEELLGRRPTVYGRYRFGLSPVMPQLLSRLGFIGGLHVPFEDGRVPEGSQFKIRWEGTDGTALDTIAKPPLDASKPETFLGLAIKLGESMDRDHVASVCMAHWPGKSSIWFDDLRRIARYCPALGQFMTIEAYFEKTDVPSLLDRHDIDQYRAPYLKQQVIRRQPDPLSSITRYWQRRAAEQARSSLRTLAALVRGGKTPTNESFRERIDACVEDVEARQREANALDQDLTSALNAAATDLAQVIPTAKTSSEQGTLVFNPASYVRRIGVKLPELPGLPPIGRPIYAAADGGNVKHVVVDVPPMGFVWVAPAKEAQKPAKKEILLAEGNLLRNEYFEVLINTTTGALQSIHEYNARNNRLSQQVALRMVDGDGDADDGAVYSVMAADKVEVTASSTAMGEITSTGRLLDRRGKLVGKFVQKFQVWRGSRVLRMELDLETLAELKSDPWNSYYCVRWAWSDEAAELARGVNDTRFVTDAKRFEAPHYVEITDTRNRTTILTGGLPYHRRSEYRLLDTLLVVRGETNRKFTFGVGVELAQPMQDALGLLTPPVMLDRKSPPPTPATSSWLFHLDAKNVVATHWEPLERDGQVRGFRTRVVEIAGRPTQVALSAFRPVAKARLLNFRGETIGEARVDAGKIMLDIAASEWIYVEAEW